MRFLGLLLCALALSACRVQTDSDNALNVEPGSPAVALFAWSRGDLPACFSGRFGASVFVYDQQRDFQCDATTSTWR
jgi:hypothetical protein